jgi:hypothetical protein
VSHSALRPQATAVIAHGLGSNADFIRKAFGRSLLTAGYDLVTWDDQSGDIETITDELGRLAVATGAELVGGVSLGGHAAVRWAAGRDDLHGVLVALPLSVSTALSYATLRRLRCPVGLLAFDDQPPFTEVAMEWAKHLACATVSSVASQAPVRDARVLGDSTVRAWLQARG